MKKILRSMAFFRKTSHRRRLKPSFFCSIWQIVKESKSGCAEPEYVSFPPSKKTPQAHQRQMSLRRLLFYRYSVAVCQDLALSAFQKECEKITSTAYNSSLPVSISSAE